ncbi:MAG: ribosome-binding factor A [bacterium]
MSQRRTSEIKKARKKSLLLREVSELIQSIATEEPDIATVYVTRVDLSADTGICYVYFGSFPDPSEQDPQRVFAKALEKLKLYKPSVRKALGRILQGRYVPDLVFLFDEKKEKVERINELLDKAYEDVEGFDTKK